MFFVSCLYISLHEYFSNFSPWSIPCLWKRYIYIKRYGCYCTELRQYFQLPDKNYIYKETDVSARRLLQYFQFPDKHSGDISWYIYIYNFFVSVFQNSYVFIPLFLSEPQTVFSGTQFDKHCLTPRHICHSPVASLYFGNHHCEVSRTLWLRENQWHLACVQLFENATRFMLVPPKSKSHKITDHRKLSAVISKPSEAENTGRWWLPVCARSGSAVQTQCSVRLEH